MTCARSDSQSVKLRGHSDRTSTSFSARQYPFMLQTLDRFNLERLARPKQCFCCAAVELTSTHEIGGAVSEKSQPRVGPFTAAVPRQGKTPAAVARMAGAAASLVTFLQAPGEWKSAESTPFLGCRLVPAPSWVSSCPALLLTQAARRRDILDRKTTVSRAMKGNRGEGEALGK